MKIRVISGKELIIAKKLRELSKTADYFIMNIFVLSEDPVEAAIMQCDKHVIKMSLETAQLLCSPFENGHAPYRRTHYNHPCAVWTRTSRENYEWLLTHGRALCAEYTFRYQRVHKSAEVIAWCAEHFEGLVFPQRGLTPFALTMDDEYKLNGAVASYRNFYIKAKSRFARWERGRDMPAWYREAFNEAGSEPSVVKN